MLSNLLHFHFLRPWWLCALIPLGFILWRMYTKPSRYTVWQKVCDPHLLDYLLRDIQKAQTLWPLRFLALAWFCAVFALAGPTWKLLPQPVYRALSSWVIVLDVSDSMDAKDIHPSRLARAKFKVLDLLNANRDSRFAMVAFTSQPFTISPLTQDAKTIASLVPALQTDIMPIQGSNIAAGIQHGVTLLKQAGDIKNGHVLLLTASTVKSNDIKIAKQLHNKQGVDISVIGIGTVKGAPIPRATGKFVMSSQDQVMLSKLDLSGLKALAKAGGGHYASYTNDAQDINYIMAPSKQQMATQASLATQVSQDWLDEGRWFLLIVVIITLFAFRRGWLEEVLR